MGVGVYSMKTCVQNGTIPSMAGRKPKPEMLRVNIKLHAEHKAWLEAQTEGRVLEDGSKDTLSGYLYRIIEAERERVEAAEALAEKRARNDQ